MVLRGRVENGVVVLTHGARLPEGAVVDVIPVAEGPGPSLPAPGQKPPYPVSVQQREAVLGLIGMWKAENPPSDEEVERMIEEYRMKKYG
jgi:hypothetical protein